jgi:thioredoxin 1
MTQEVNIDNIDEVLKEKSVTLLQFSAEWCGPCKMLTPIISTLAEEYSDKDANILKINVDSNAEIGHKFNVRAIPTVIIFKDGIEQNRLVGMNMKDSYKMALDSLL